MFWMAPNLSQKICHSFSYSSRGKTGSRRELQHFGPILFLFQENYCKRNNQQKNTQSHLVIACWKTPISNKLNLRLFPHKNRKLVVLLQLRVCLFRQIRLRQLRNWFTKNVTFVDLQASQIKCTSPNPKINGTLFLFSPLCLSFLSWRR